MLGVGHWYKGSVMPGHTGSGPGGRSTRSCGGLGRGCITWPKPQPILNRKIAHEAVVYFGRKANLPTITNNATTNKVLWLLEKWHNLSKSRNKTSVNESNKREKFSEFLSCLFEISPSDWKERIRATRNKDTACDDKCCKKAKRLVD